MPVETGSIGLIGSSQDGLECRHDVCVELRFNCLSKSESSNTTRHRIPVRRSDVIALYASATAMIREE